MYAIYGNIYHQYTPFMLAYIPYMDPMGNHIVHRGFCFLHFTLLESLPSTFQARRPMCAFQWQRFRLIFTRKATKKTQQQAW